MKLYNFGAFSLLTVILATTPHPHFFNEYLDVERVGPFDLNTMDDSTDIGLGFYVYYNGKVKVRVSVGSNKYRPIYSVVSKAYEAYENVVTLTLQAEIKRFFSASGLNFYFELMPYENDVGSIFSSETKLFPINTETINPFTLPSKTYISEVYAFESSYNHVSEFYSTYDFSHLLDYFEETNFTKLKYEDSYFIYKGMSEFNFYDAYIEFFDSHGLFNSMTTYKNGYKRIPLYLYKGEDGKVTVRMKDIWYLNKISLEISEDWKYGYDLVDEFYLPRNFRDCYEDYDFNVVFKDIGDDKLDVIYPLSYAATNNFFGLCSNSENCLTGGVR